MKNWIKYALIGFAASLGDGCDSKPVPTKPGEAKLAGFSPGFVRLCALVESGGADTITVSAYTWSNAEQDLVLKKTDKGYCTYFKVDWQTQGKLYPFTVKPKDNKIKELGIYHTDDKAKDNPAEEDFKYVKLTPEDKIWHFMLEADVETIKVPTQ